MKAVVLAAGKGRRLSGVIDDTPKPMVCIEGRPVLEWNIKWLKSSGISDICINLHHLPDVITDHFGDGAEFGVNLSYSYEPRLLGTAGAVKKIADQYWRRPESFIVVYGDNRFDLDLSRVIDLHFSKAADATIALHYRQNVTQSGIVVIDHDARIHRFVEKPKPNEIISNLVNAGLYVMEPKVLDYIPSGREVDFGKDVFPKLLNTGGGMFGIEIAGTVTPIDTPELLSNADKPYRPPPNR